MRYLRQEIWDRLAFADFRPRFFIEAFTEKLSMNTPHFYQSRLMSVFSSCAEALTYIGEYQTQEKNGSYVISTLDEIDRCWSEDPIARALFGHMDEARKFVFKRIRGGDLGPPQLNRLAVICKAVLGFESEYANGLLTALRSQLTDATDVTAKDRITANIYKLTGIYITHLLNKGYSPTYLFNRAEMFTRPNNYAGRSFVEQFEHITGRLESQTIQCEVYFGIQASSPNQFLRVDDDPVFTFLASIPETIRGHDKEKLERGLQVNVVAKSIVEATDYVTAAWQVKEQLDKFLDAITALDVNPRIKTSSHCVVIYTIQQVTHTNTLNIDLLISFLTSEGGTHFSGSAGSIRQTLAILSGDGKEHLGRSLRYLRLARESVSPELKLLNLWIALVELPRFGGHRIVLVSDFVFPDVIDLTPSPSLPPAGGRSAGSMLPISHAPARS